MSYTATRTHIPDVVILDPKVFGDSRSAKGVLRGRVFDLAPLLSAKDQAASSFANAEVYA